MLLVEFVRCLRWVAIAALGVSAVRAPDDQTAIAFVLPLGVFLWRAATDRG